MKNEKTYLYALATIAILVVLALLRISLDKSSPASYEPEEITEESETESLEPEIDTMNLVILEEPYVPEPIATPVTPKSSYSSRSYESSYSSSDESEGSYWEEKRKTSPNDNYLLGFDEDVDDVHDMELYIEDY